MESIKTKILLIWQIQIRFNFNHIYVTVTKLVKKLYNNVV